MLGHCKKENQNRRHPFWSVCCWHIHPWCGICCLKGHKTSHTKCITKQRHMHRLGRLRCRRKLCQTPGQLNEIYKPFTNKPSKPQHQQIPSAMNHLSRMPVKGSEVHVNLIVDIFAASRDCEQKPAWKLGHQFQIFQLQICNFPLKWSGLRELAAQI